MSRATQGVQLIPRSRNATRLASNLDATSWELSPADASLISAAVYGENNAPPPPPPPPKGRPHAIGWSEWVGSELWSLGSRLGSAEQIERSCSAPHHLTRLIVYSGAVVDALAADCSDGTHLSRGGGPGGAALTADFPVDGLARLTLRAGSLVDSIGGIGGSGGSDRFVECADGYRIGGFGVVVGEFSRGKTSRIVLAVRFLCTAAPQPMQLPSLDLGSPRDARSHAAGTPAKAESSGTQPASAADPNLVAIGAIGSLALLLIACIWKSLGKAAPSKDL